MKVHNCCMALPGIVVDFSGDCWFEAVALMRCSANILMRKCNQYHFEYFIDLEFLISRQNH